MPTNMPGKGADEFDGKDEILLGLLTAVDRDSNISQRRISHELGVALGLANAYLKRCVRKGWIKVQHVPRRRYLYYLTPQGFAEKARLSAEYLSSSFNFFRKTRAQLSELMELCASKGWERVACAGSSDLAEVATVCAHEFPLKVVGIIDAAQAGTRFCGLPVFKSLAECGDVDAVILTSLDQPEAVYGHMIDQIAADRVLVPYMLRMAIPKSAGKTSAAVAASGAAAGTAL